MTRTKSIFCFYNKYKCNKYKCISKLTSKQKSNIKYLCKKWNVLNRYHNKKNIGHKLISDGNL